MDRSAFVHVQHYNTDNCVAHPLSKTHIGCVGHRFDPSHKHGEAEDPTTALGKIEKEFRTLTSCPSLAGCAVSAGCAITHLTGGEGYDKGTVKCINGAAGFLKRLTTECRLHVRMARDHRRG